MASSFRKLLGDLAELLRRRVKAPQFGILIVGEVTVRPDGSRFISSLGMVASTKDDSIVRTALKQSLGEDHYLNIPMGES